MCSPSSGGKAETWNGVSLRLTPLLTVWIVPCFGCSSSMIRSRCLTWGSSNNLVEAIDGGVRHVVFAQRVQPVLPWLGLDDVLEQSLELLVVRQPILTIPEPGVVRQLPDAR